MTYASAASIRRDVAALLKPPRRVQISEAVAETMRVQGPSGSWIPWDREITPYMIEPLDLLNSREFDAEIFVGPARTGKTQALIDGWVAYDIKNDPSDFLVVQISQDKAAEYSKKRIDRMITRSPDLIGCLSPRHHDNNIHDKIFRAGNYLKLGWPSKNILASTDYRRVAITDYDRIAPDVDGEGEAFWLGKKRTQVFMSRGMTLAESSPGFEVTDIDWREDPNEPHAAPPSKGVLSLYNLGDRRVLYWQCPECDQYFPARFEYLTWNERETDILAASEQVCCICPRCGVADIPPSLKDQMIQSSRWPKEGQSVDKHGEYQGDGRRSRIASFWMEGPAAAFQSWGQLVYNYLAAEADYDRTGNQEKLKTTTNVDQGRPYQFRRSQNKRSPERLKERISPDIVKRTVPDGVRFLIAAVDVQGGKDRRFVVQVHGFGEGLESWVIDRYNIKKSDRKDSDGNTLQTHPGANPEDWDLLEKYILDRGYPLADDSGREMPIKMLAVDHGGESGVSENAYKFYRRMNRNGKAKRVMLVKGGSHSQLDKVKASFPDNTKRKDRKVKAKGDVPLHLLAVNKLKDWASNLLEREDVGEGYVHFNSWLGDWFYEELTYEERDPAGKWDKPGNGANEAWDLFVYSLAACVLLKADRMNWDSPHSWAKPWDENPNIIDPNDTPKTQISRPARRSRIRFK